MPTGGTLVIAARDEAISAANSLNLKPGRYICLETIDTGSGMDEGTLARAVEPFFTTKGVGKGTGLGLSMVHGLAEQSGGALTLKSKVGQGTTAQLWLPVAERCDRATERDPHGIEREPSGARPALTIVVVDDDDLVRVNMALLLEDLGHRVIAAASGAEALDALRREPDIDLVITDQAMPNMAGSQLATAIATEWPHLPVVIATGYAELPPGVGRKLRKLDKPFTQADLVRVIAEVVSAGARAGMRSAN
jgi:CheY-like chemotaxis protein